jgi:GAG-pre-integrase domain
MRVIMSRSYYLMGYIDDNLVYTCEQRKNIYYLTFYHFEYDELCLNATTSDLWLWHQRLAHISIDSIKKLIQLELACGLPSRKL